MFDDKILTITGGTGSFGNAVFGTLLATNVKELRILSRDEKKQDYMRRLYDDKKIKFFLGDVRDHKSISPAVRGADFCFSRCGFKTSAFL